MASAKACRGRGRYDGGFVDSDTVYLVKSYLGRRGETERLCTAGVVVWR